MRLTIKQPCVDPVLPWQLFSDRILNILNNRYDIEPTDENCGMQLGDFLEAEMQRYIALQVFGNTLPQTVQIVRELKITGDGACPACGSNNRTEITGSFKYCEEHGIFSTRTIGWQCMQCGEETRI